MAIRMIREENEPILRKISKPVKEITPKITELIEDMLDTMYEANGVGLAAPQVGMLKRVHNNGIIFVISSYFSLNKFYHIIN